MIFEAYKHKRLADLMTEPWGDLRIPGLLELIEFARPSCMVEIGSHRGVAAEVFLLHCERVTCVDPWEEERIFQDFCNRVGAYPHLSVIRGKSPEALDKVSGLVDFVYIDGDHSYDAVCRDIKACQALWPDATLAGHDYNGVATPGVRAAVHELIGPPTMIFPDSSWVV